MLEAVIIGAAVAGGIHLYRKLKRRRQMRREQQQQMDAQTNDRYGGGTPDNQIPPQSPPSIRKFLIKKRHVEAFRSIR